MSQDMVVIRLTRSIDTKVQSALNPGFDTVFVHMFRKNGCSVVSLACGWMNYFSSCSSRVLKYRSCSEIVDE